ncbi:MAG: Wzz/FepE/Etk N-terminal domain-containing protein, partial [Candidatus Zixiibacteriota bacterium]
MNNKQSQNLWLFIEVLAKRRNLIVTIITIATILAIGISFILPEWYTAKALLLPPKNISTSITGLGNISEAVSITSGLNLPILATT